MIGASRLTAVVRKELIQFLRDPVMLGLIVYLHTVEVLICAYALSFDVRHLPTVLADLDHSAASRQLADRFQSSGYFDIDYRATREREIADLLDRGKAVAALVIPPDFSRDVARGTEVSVQLLLDGSNANTASVAQGYAQRIVQSYALDRLRATAQGPPTRPVEHRPRIWYNSELRYLYFMVLSMIAQAAMMVGVITTAASIVREKESGTMEQMLVTPVRPAELIVAKMVPTLVVGLLALVPSLIIAAALGVPLRGSLVLFFLLSAAFLASSMGIGIFVATFADTLQQALLMSFFALFPVLFLSGTLVPVESMPVWLQYVAQLSPLTHYMDALLGIFLKGVGLEVLWPRAAGIVLIAAVLLAAGMVQLRRRMR